MFCQKYKIPEMVIVICGICGHQGLHTRTKINKSSEVNKNADVEHITYEREMGRCERNMLQTTRKRNILSTKKKKKKKNPPWPESASELYQLSDRLLSTKLVPTFSDRGHHVVSVTDFYGRILSLLDRSRYFFFQVAPQLYSRGSVDPVPDPLLLRKSGSTKNRIQTSGSAARNSDH
jgi:hypothetical protein